jgi:ABC-2 type transport system permease protein
MLRRYSRLLSRFFALSLRNLSEFRLDFWMSLLHNLIYQGIFLVFWRSVVAFTGDRLGTWSFPDLAALSAFTLMASAVMQWFVGLLRLPGKIVEGDLDKYLSKPVSPLFAMLAEEVDGLSCLQQSAGGALILIAVAAVYRLPVTPASALASLFLLVLGCLVLLLVQGCVALTGFWLGDVSRVQQVMMIAGEFERYPLTVFSPWVQRLLTWVLPVGLVSTYPVLVFLGRAPLLGWPLAAAAGLAAFWIPVFSFLWQKALVRYESFGG